VAAVWDVRLRRRDVVAVLDVGDRNRTLGCVRRGNEAAVRYRRVRTIEVRLALLGPPLTGVDPALDGVEDDPALGDGLDGAVRRVFREPVGDAPVAACPVASGRVARVVDVGLSGGLAGGDPRETVPGGAVTQEEFRAAVAVLSAETAQALVEELDSRVACEPVVFVECGVEDEYRLYGDALVLGGVDRTTERSVILDPEVGSVPE
jgi:hypothetical protein